MKIYKECAWVVLSFIVGSIFSLILLGPLVLHPTVVNMLDGDTLQHFIGWEFYRNSPWQLPIAYTSNLLYPLGTGIIFTDSFPIVSIILKMFSHFLPEPFIWHGLVAVINSSLMFYSGFILFRTVRGNTVFGIIGAFFTLFSAVFVYRLTMHFSLTTQWLIMFNLVLLLKPKINTKVDMCWQLLLLFISCGVHPYITAMLCPLAISFCFRVYIKNELKVKALIFNILSCCLCVLLAAALFGWFIIGTDGQDAGFGFYSSNLLSLINPEFGSLFFRNVQVGGGQYEGFAYLGLGNILMLVYILLFNNPKAYLSFKKEYLVYYLSLLLLFFFALSNTIQIGGYQVTSLSFLYLPEFSVFRSSGRFIWPVFYSIQVFALITMYDLLQNKGTIHKWLLLTFCLFIQVLDNSSLLNQLQSHWDDCYNSSSFNQQGLNSWLWHNFGSYGVKHLVLLDSITDGTLQSRFGVIAIENGLTMNTAYVARTSKQLEDMKAQINQNFNQGRLEKATLYVGSGGMINQLPSYCTTLDQFYICSLNKDLISAAETIRK